MSLLGIALMVLSGAAQAQCENLRVIVRNSVYSIHGLEAFCTEFNRMKAELAGMRSELSIANKQNQDLRARLTGSRGRVDEERLVRVSPAQRDSESKNRSQ